MLCTKDIQHVNIASHLFVRPSASALNASLKWLQPFSVFIYFYVDVANEGEL